MGKSIIQSQLYSGALPSTPMLKEYDEIVKCIQMGKYGRSHKSRFERYEI